MVHVRNLRPFQASHSLSMQAAVQCILLAQRYDSRDGASRWRLLICIKLRSRLLYANYGRPAQLAASGNSEDSFKLSVVAPK